MRNGVVVYVSFTDDADTVHLGVVGSYVSSRGEARNAYVTAGYAGALSCFMSTDKHGQLFGTPELLCGVVA